MTAGAIAIWVAAIVLASSMFCIPVIAAWWDDHQATERERTMPRTAHGPAVAAHPADSTQPTGPDAYLAYVAASVNESNPLIAARFDAFTEDYKGCSLPT